MVAAKTNSNFTISMLLKKYHFLIIALVIIVVLALIYFLEALFPPKETSEEQQEEQEKSEEKTNQELVWPHTFDVMSKGYPKFISGKFSKDSRKLKPGEIFDASIKVEDPDGIVEVKFTIIGQEETLKKEINLKLVEGDEFSGEWQGSLTIPEEMTHITGTSFYTQNKLGKERDLNLGG